MAQILDLLNNRQRHTSSTDPHRKAAAGFRGKVAETVAINPAVAISGIELINQWYYNLAFFAIMSDRANTQIGVWPQNSLDRTVVVAVCMASLIDLPRAMRPGER